MTTTYNFKTILAIFILGITNAVTGYTIPLLGQAGDDTHVVVEGRIEAVQHQDVKNGSINIPLGGLYFQVSKVVAVDQPQNKSITATVSTPAGTASCSIPIDDASLASDTIYPCGDGMIGYPKAGHKVVIGYQIVDG
jgi:hypothetical protein